MVVSWLFKSGPNVVCFAHLDFEMCFVPQRRALLTSKRASRHNGVHFSHISTSKSGPTMVFFTIWRGNVLRATMACNSRVFLCTDGLRTCRLSEPTFRPSRATKRWKTQCFATFLPFHSPGSSFSWPFLFSDILSSFLLFSSLTLPTSTFSSVHIVGSLTSKLPLINGYFVSYIWR